MSTGQVRITLNAGAAALPGVAFSPDGTTLAAVTREGAVLTWTVALPRPAAAIAAVCSLVHRAATPQETARYLPRQNLPAACPQR